MNLTDKGTESLYHLGHGGVGLVEIVAVVKLVHPAVGLALHTAVGEWEFVRPVVPAIMRRAIQRRHIGLLLLHPAQVLIKPVRQQFHVLAQFRPAVRLAFLHDELGVHARCLRLLHK